jgi:hypothetical protein
MKLIPAGQSSSLAQDYRNYLFNCTRNPNCQKKFYIPIRQLSDLVLYADLPGKPSLIEIKLYNLCDIQSSGDTGGDFNNDFSDDFYIGDPTLFYGTELLLSNIYIVGQKPDFSWYGVFGDLIYTGTAPLYSFFLQFTFTINEQQYIFYTEQFQIEDCDPLLFLRGCYPKEQNSSDCNGIYYGNHAGPDTPLGESYYRYIHWAYVRKGSVIDKSTKLSFTFFNSKRAYKNVLTREKVLEFELIPAFYKDYLLGIFGRGNIEIAQGQFKLTQEQNWSVLDYDSKLWQMDVSLDEDCKNYFGCKPSDCAIVVPDPEDPQTCLNSPDNLTFEKVFDPESLPSGEWIQIDDDNGTHYFLDMGTRGFFDVFPQPTLPLPTTVGYSSLTSVAAGPADFALYVITHFFHARPIIHTGSFTTVSGSPWASMIVILTFTGGTIDSGDTLTWEVYNNATNDLVTQGISFGNPFTAQFSASVIDPEVSCLRVRWKKNCHSGLSTDWQELLVGNCAPPPLVVRGSIDVFLVFSPGNDEHKEKMVINFEGPTPGDISYEAGWDFKSNGGFYIDTSNSYPAPRTFANYNPGCGITAGATIIPSGTTNYKKYLTCVDPSGTAGYPSKVVFYNVVLPAGYSLVLTPARSNLVVEIR